MDKTLSKVVRKMFAGDVFFGEYGDIIVLGLSKGGMKVAALLHSGSTCGVGPMFEQATDVSGRYAKVSVGKDAYSVKDIVNFAKLGRCSVYTELTAYKRQNVTLVETGDVIEGVPKVTYPEEGENYIPTESTAIDLGNTILARSARFNSLTSTDDARLYIANPWLCYSSGYDGVELIHTLVATDGHRLASESFKDILFKQRMWEAEDEFVGFFPADLLSAFKGWSCVDFHMDHESRSGGIVLLENRSSSMVSLVWGGIHETPPDWRNVIPRIDQEKDRVDVPLFNNLPPGLKKNKDMVSIVGDDTIDTQEYPALIFTDEKNNPTGIIDPDCSLPPPPWTLTKVATYKMNYFADLMSQVVKDWGEEGEFYLADGGGIKTMVVCFTPLIDLSKRYQPTEGFHILMPTRPNEDTIRLESYDNRGVNS
jgi:hypothetical protein